MIVFLGYQILRKQTVENTCTFVAIGLSTEGMIACKCKAKDVTGYTWMCKLHRGLLHKGEFAQVKN
jgi:hypothetical protein